MDHNDAHCREEVLLGERLTVGVVRIGDTVRRPVKPQSLFVARLLTHLTHIGFDGAPRFLGRDEHDRDILSFIPGWVPAHFQRFENEQVWGQDNYYNASTRQPRIPISWRKGRLFVITIQGQTTWFSKMVGLVRL